METSLRNVIFVNIACRRGEVAQPRQISTIATNPIFMMYLYDKNKFQPKTNHLDIKFRTE